MDGYLLVLALAALPAAGNFLGGVVAEVFSVSERTLSLALHLAAGIVLAVVGLELMPEALSARPPWVPILAFVAGGAVFIVIGRLVDHLRSRMGPARGPRARWRSSPVSRSTCSVTVS